MVASSPRAAGPVSAAAGPSSATLSTVARTKSRNAVNGTPAVSPDAFGLAEKGHEMVGCDHSRGVIGGPVDVGHLEGPTAEISHHLAGQRVARDCEPASRAQPSGAGGRVGHGDERVHGCGPPMAR